MKLKEQVPTNELPREKLLSLGANHLTDSELIAILLRTGFSGTSVLDLSRQLIEEFGNLKGLLTASQDELCTIKGMSQNKFALLQAALEIGRRFAKFKMQETLEFDSVQAAADYFNHHLAQQEHEVFAALFLNQQYQLIKFEILFEGTINQASVYPREVVKKALKLNAAAMIVSHNHPSGRLEASSSDKLLTEKLKESLALVEVKLLDHIIVGPNEGYYSFANHGLL